ncbi:hypothetical protein BT63DRAFT_418837 [Microthyrium microscopicum]|uniref:Uncharacterized protein n=1 Tax=Microthyrium microscopicum TaxID=703497 RepID=A0A6A6TV51_9PEZI|nr:hypothetical protein BT63DRAFT_418837 [Microthyrium microscopicum]
MLPPNKNTYPLRQYNPRSHSPELPNELTPDDVSATLRAARLARLTRLTREAEERIDKLADNLKEKHTTTSSSSSSSGNPDDDDEWEDIPSPPLPTYTYIFGPSTGETDRDLARLSTSERQRTLLEAEVADLNYIHGIPCLDPPRYSSVYGVRARLRLLRTPRLMLARMRVRAREARGAP